METSIYRLRTGDLLVLCVLALLALGGLMVQSAAMNVRGIPTDKPLLEAVSKVPGWQWNERGAKHFCFAIAGVVAFLVVGQIDYQRLRIETDRTWKHPIFWLVIAAVLASILVLVPGIGTEVNGARRWIKFAGIQLQPSELCKWAVVLFLAWQITANKLDLARFKHFLLLLLPLGTICLLVVIQDFGTAALIAMCGLTMLLAGRVKLWHLLVVIPPLLMAAAWFVMHKEYRWRRMTSFMNPYADPQGEGYHMIQSLLSFATGGVTGRGLGNGVQKLGYLPEDTTDFIFAVVCEELGLFGALFVVVLYLGILYVAWQVVQQKRDSFGRLLAFGIGAMVGLQAMINIAVATVSVPTKGLSLPLVSAGGSGLIITCAALGLLYSVTRFEHDEETAGYQPKHKRDPLAVSTSDLAVEQIWRELSIHH